MGRRKRSAYGSPGHRVKIGWDTASRGTWHTPAFWGRKRRRIWRDWRVNNPQWRRRKRRGSG